MDYVNSEANVLIMLASTRSCDLLFDVCRCVFGGVAAAAGAGSGSGMPAGRVNTNVDLIRSPVMAGIDAMTEPNSKTNSSTKRFRLDECIRILWNCRTPMSCMTLQPVSQSVNQSISQSGGLRPGQASRVIYGRPLCPLFGVLNYPVKWTTLGSLTHFRLNS